LNWIGLGAVGIEAGFVTGYQNSAL
jgi:hypothetical protein